MTELLVVRSKIKDVAVNAAKKLGGDSINVSSDFADALSEEVEKLIARSVERAKANKRSTIQARDI